ncbi:MAG: serine hydrolase domain-containing protein, partial [Gemmatimonadota bacterium]
MRSRLFAILTFALLTTALHAQDPRIARMRDYLSASAALGRLNGSVLVAEGGTVLIDTAFGFANMELEVPNTPDTRFRVASVTKQFTAMAVLMLAEAGKLRIGDSISRYLDSLPAEWSGITIHQLLRHVSGISDYEEWFDGYDTQAYSNYMAQDSSAYRIARDARGRPLDFVPGTQFHYSNSAYILLGFIIERASGMRYEDFLRDRILEPLGMAHSSQDRSLEILPGRAVGYQMRPGAYPVAWWNGASRKDWVNAHYQLMLPPQGDAGLVTTARDLYAWDQALYTERLVKRSMLDSIFTPGLGNYGYGWFILHGPDGVTYEHSGGLPGFTCDIMRIPDSHRTIILLTNTDRLGTTVRDLATIMRGQPVATPTPRHLVAPDSARNAAFAGIYRAAQGDSVEVTMNGAVLVAWWRDHFRAGMYPESARDYFVPLLAGVARFGERNGRKELVIEDGFGKEVVRGT